MSEMDKLDAALTQMGVKHSYNRDFKGGSQIVAFDGKNQYLWDAVCIPFSYGGDCGLIEIMGEYLLGHDDVEGWLKAKDVLELIKNPLGKNA